MVSTTIERKRIMSIELKILAEKHEKEKSLSLSYRLFESMLHEEDGFRAEYSISASVLNTESGEREEMLIRDVTSSKDFAEDIFTLICRGKVTPMSLEDTISDLIG